MTCAEYSEYIILLSTFWIEILNFHIFLYPLKYVPDPCDVKMDRNKQRHLQRRTPMIYYVTGFFKHSKSWNKNKDIYDQSSPRFSHCKKYIYNTAQIDFGFGQFHIVWWLSYSQVGEKISVEPWVDITIFQNPLQKLRILTFWLLLGGGGGGHFDEKKIKKNHFFKGCGEKTTITRLIIKLAPWNYFHSIEN